MELQIPLQDSVFILSLVCLIDPPQGPTAEAVAADSTDCRFLSKEDSAMLSTH